MRLQDAMTQLSGFWTDQGYQVLLPATLEIPAGILHPEAFFRLLGGGPWRAAYPQPVYRPLDGRAGRHPFRLGRHVQFQVMTRPEAGSEPEAGLRELYLRSLGALGCDLGVHDLRFAEWNWEALSLGAWGYGWHVLLDGLGITRMTILQQLAGRDLVPPAIEISYGLERLVMAVARIDNAFKLRWAAAEEGNARLRDEIELARYAFEVADPEALDRELGDLETEARRALEAGLVRLGYELAIRSLRAIDLLETRGELSGAEREARLGRVRELVATAAELYLAERAPAKPVGAVAAGEAR